MAGLDRDSDIRAITPHLADMFSLDPSEKSRLIVGNDATLLSLPMLDDQHAGGIAVVAGARIPSQTSSRHRYAVDRHRLRRLRFHERPEDRHTCRCSPRRRVRRPPGRPGIRVPHRPACHRLHSRSLRRPSSRLSATQKRPRPLRMSSRPAASPSARLRARLGRLPKRHADWQDRLDMQGGHAQMRDERQRSEGHRPHGRIQPDGPGGKAVR